jgi:glycosyltransferase involved in cell wall biosynthesis
MAVGVPTVATAVGGVPDVVDDERTGLLVPAGNAPALAFAIERLAGDSALGRRLVAAAAGDVESRFGAARLVAETAALYRRLCDRSVGRTIPS